MSNVQTPEISSNSQDELPKEIVNSEAEKLIRDFQLALKNNPEFVQTTSNHYLGLAFDGVPLKESEKDYITFWFQNAPWEIKFGQSDQDISLGIDVYSRVGLPYKHVKINLYARIGELQSDLQPLIQVMGFSEEKNR